MRSGLWRELKEKAVLSYSKESEGSTPITRLFDSFIDETFSLLFFLLVVIYDLSTIELGNSLGG